MKKSLKRQYEKKYNQVLFPIAQKLGDHIEAFMKDVGHIDNISAHAKTVESFLKKAKIIENGRKKYEQPLQEIQDQLGARIVVLYKNDVDKVVQHIKRYFRQIEERMIVPDSEKEFGYIGKHLILALPKDTIPEAIALENSPRFFELQIKTLFQHAWSEAEHDLGYKPIAKLKKEDKRVLAFTAAQAWGADMIFQQLVDKNA